MDTITHTLFGLTLYGAINKREMAPELKKSLFFATLVGSQIPDIDVVSGLTETGKIMSQMWHRGLTHSIFLVPVWSLFISWVCKFIWKRKDPILFLMSVISVLIHIGSDALNTWGTGLLEPFSSIRVSIGVIPIVDLVFWIVMAVCWLVSFLMKGRTSHNILRIAWAVIALHVIVQSVQASMIKEQVSHSYEETVVSAGFVPTQFQVIAKKSGNVDILQASIFSKPKLIQKLPSKDNTDLRPLFTKNPRAKVLHAWSPFVVIINDDKRLGIYDPRFYRNGESFLAEYMNK